MSQTQMEAKLKEYRARRRRQQFIDNIKDNLESTKEKFINFLVPKPIEMDNKEEEVLLLEEEEHSSINNSKACLEDSIDLISETSEVENNDENQESWRYCLFKWTLYSVIWLTLYIIFLNLQFGAVFFVVSVLIGICINTSTRPKKRGEISAYSVFNKNCKSIDGTLKAEQFEKEIRYGIGTVRSF